MAYNEKYYHEYCNRFGTVCRLSVLERDYEGPAMDKDCASVPITLNYESTTDDKFDRLKASTAEVRLIGDDAFNMEELYTADSKQYKIEHVVGGQLKWTGWVVPNGFSEDWSGGLREMVIQAIDGLSLLDQYRFLTPSGDMWEGYLRHITILRQCLEFIGLDLPLHTMVNLEYDGQTSDIDPVYAAMTHASTYMDTTVEDEDTFNHTYLEYKNNVMSCYDVLIDICRVWNAKLYQNDGAWKFKRVNEDYGVLEGKFWRVYTTNSGQDGTIPYSPLITFPCLSTDEKIVLAGGVKYMDNVFRWQNVQYQYRYKQNGDDLTPLIPNGRFLPITGGPVPDPSTYVPEGWERVNVGSQFLVDKEPVFGGEHPPEGQATIKLSGLVGIQAQAGLNSENIQDQLFLKKGDKPYISWWQKTLGYAQSVVQIRLRSFKEDNTYTDYLLVNSGMKVGRNYIESRWEEKKSDTPSYNFVGYGMNNPIGSNGWSEVLIDVPDAPDDGYLLFIIITSAVHQNLAGNPNINFTGVSFHAMDQIRTGDNVSYEHAERLAISDPWYISDIITGRVVDESAKNTSKGRVYTFEQDKVFNKRSEPVNILTANVDNDDVIGGIRFNLPYFDGHIENWNDVYNPYPTNAPLGMIASRDIMRQYRNIWRVIETELISEGLDIDSCIVFEDRPNERYVVQRGYFNETDNLLTGATLLQISDENDPAFVGTETTQENYGNIDLDRRFINS